MNLTLASRFSSRFGLSTPIALAPMALASGGALAAACAHAGALGLVGGGYGELAWTQREYALAQEQAGETGRIGCGFIVWKLDEDASALDWVLEQRPRAIMLSFGDPRPFAPADRAVRRATAVPGATNGTGADGARSRSLGHHRARRRSRRPRGELAQQPRDDQLRTRSWRTGWPVIRPKPCCSPRAVSRTGAPWRRRGCWERTAR